MLHVNNISFRSPNSISYAHSQLSLFLFLFFALASVFVRYNMNICLSHTDKLNAWNRNIPRSFHIYAIRIIFERTLNVWNG